MSEGRRPDVLGALADAVRSTPGIRLLDCSADWSHHRSVLTFAAAADPLLAAVLSLYARALPLIDLRVHRGCHPRIGAIDVVPFVPLPGATMAECVALARRTGAAVADRFGVPVILYEEAAAVPGRRNLADIRRGGFEGLAERLAAPGWAPDFGPRRPHPTAGASAIGARRVLVAYNVNLATDRLEVAQTIARTVRASSGGLPAVKALGLRLEPRGIVQVSMNLTDYERTSLAQAFEAVSAEAARHHVAVLESEIVGLVPAAALDPAAAPSLRLTGFHPGKVLENRLRAAAGD